MHWTMFGMYIPDSIVNAEEVVTVTAYSDSLGCLAGYRGISGSHCPKAGADIFRKGGGQSQANKCLMNIIYMHTLLLEPVLT